MPEHSTRRDVLQKGGAAAGAAGIASIAGCSSLLGGVTGGGGGGEVVVGSKQFTEQKILGYMTYHTLKENSEVTAKDQVGLGGTTTNFEALKSDQIDTYWEYTGTAWLTLPPQHEEVITDPQEIYNRVDQEFNEEHDLDFLSRAPFNNTYVLVANPQWQSEAGVENFSEFAEYIKNGNTDITVVMNAEFQERSDGWPGLVEAYDMADAASELNIRNVGSGLTYQVVGNGEAQVGMGFNTNPKILKFDLVTLQDDQGFFPVYNPAPLCRNDVLSDGGPVASALNPIGESLSTETIRELNRRVSIDGEGAKTVARDHLSSNGLI